MVQVSQPLSTCPPFDTLAMTDGNPWEYAAFMYHAPDGAPSMTAYQTTHQLDEAKQAHSAHSLIIPSLAYHWPHFPGTCQCVAPAPHCPQPAFGLYGYANQYPAHPMSAFLPPFQAPQPHSLHMHAGTAYQRDTAFSGSLQRPESLPLYPPLPRAPSGPVAYKSPLGHGSHDLPFRHQKLNDSSSHPQGGKSKQKDAQHQFGPPQKPLQCRYALWVGGIPSETHVLELCHHFFMPDTAGDILSVVLMPRSHSGFINFRTARSCKAAAYRFNNSELNNAFLRCRCRRPISEVDASVPTSESISASSIPNSDIPPASATESNFSIQFSDEETAVGSLRSESHSQGADTISVGEQEDEILHPANTTEIHASLPPSDSSIEDHHKSCRYFLIKSLTIEELVASVRSARWATQSQNEALLNEAFQKCDAVYLIFSVNRSGEFFGYARMASQITTDTAAAFAKKHSSAAEKPSGTFAASNSFKIPAKGLVPDGRVVDELYRGKIFWELCDSELSAPSHNADTNNEATISSFKVDWITVRKLPFWQTRHLQNAWNDNKLVKVGRDGTELETEVGRRLCHLFLSPPARKNASRVIS